LTTAPLLPHHLIEGGSPSLVFQSITPGHHLEFAADRFLDRDDGRASNTKEGSIEQNL
jgi:hypothetical protein